MLPLKQKGNQMEKGPGKAYRKGISLMELFERFPNDETAERYFTDTRWPTGPRCPFCGSSNVQSGAKHKTMPYRCREKQCAKRFSAKTGTVMEGSKLGFRVWIIAMYLFMTNLKSVSSMKLHRDLKITQKSAWFLAHRLRESWKEGGMPFLGPVEADETYMGGLRKNMSHKKRKELEPGRGGAGKTIVAGVKDRATNQIKAAVIEGTDAYTLQTFVEDRVHHEATVYTDEHGAYKGMVYFEHDSVRHSRGEYVKKDTAVHTQGIESFWAMLKRAHKGTFHKISPKHLHRYVTEFTGRHNARSLDTEDQMKKMIAGMRGRRLKYPDLVS